MSLLRPALVLFGSITVITGLAYPFAITGISQLLFSDATNGSLVERNGKLVGSELIGQSFTSDKYFWSRPSATGPEPYNAAASGGSNLGPLNPVLHEAVKGRIEALRAAHPDQTSPVPVDLVTASGSGLDPHITPAAAYYQAGRIAKNRQLPTSVVTALIATHIESRWLAVLGEPVVNVLQLNLALDDLPVPQ